MSRPQLRLASLPGVDVCPGADPRLGHTVSAVHGRPPRLDPPVRAGRSADPQLPLIEPTGPERVRPPGTGALDIVRMQQIKPTPALDVAARHAEEPEATGVQILRRPISAFHPNHLRQVVRELPDIEPRHTFQQLRLRGHGNDPLVMEAPSVLTPSP